MYSVLLLLLYLLPGAPVPPPPPPVGAGLNGPPRQARSSAGGPPPPPSRDNKPSPVAAPASSGRVDLLASIRAGFSLKPVEVKNHQYYYLFLRDKYIPEG